MKERYFRISYQWPPGSRGGIEKVVAVHDDGSSTAEMAEIAIEKLHQRLGAKAKVLGYNKLPSNYQPRGDEID